jgi:BASS family bile acid:Na+ symporter
MDVVALAKQTFIIAVLFIPFASGLQARPSNALTLVRELDRGLRAFTALFLIMPAVTIGLCLMAGLPRPTNGALIALSVAPMLPTLHLLLRQVGADHRFVVRLEVGAALTSLVMVPAWFWIVSQIVGIAIPIDLQSMLLSLVKGLFVPLAVGMVVNVLSKGRSEAIGPWIVTIATYVVIACGLTLMWHHREAVMEQMQWGTLLLIFLFVVIGLTVGHLLGGPEPGNRAALALATSGRHVGMSIAIVHTVMPDLFVPTVATLLGYALLRPLITIPYTRRAKALHAATAPA